jgi:competence protein ComEA
MFKRFLAALFALIAATAFAAVDVNKATQAELEGVKGIGPAIAGKILDERKKGSFKDWPDLVDRVKGVGDTNAAKFSAEGLTVNGSGFKGAAAKPAAETKPAAKAADAKAADAKPAAKAADAKPADAAKAADKPTAADKAKEKADKKAAKKAEKAEKADKAASAAKK